MNRIIMAAWIASFGLGMSAGLTACGGNTCDDLADRCNDECNDSQAAACEALANAAKDQDGGEDGCQQLLDNFTCAAFGGF